MERVFVVEETEQTLEATNCKRVSGKDRQGRLASYAWSNRK